MLGLGLRAIIAFVVTHLDDERASGGSLPAAAGFCLHPAWRQCLAAAHGPFVPPRLALRFLCKTLATLITVLLHPHLCCPVFVCCCAQIVSPEVQSRLLHMVLDGMQELVRLPAAWLAACWPCRRRQLLAACWACSWRLRSCTATAAIAVTAGLHATGQLGAHLGTSSTVPTVCPCFSP